MISQTKEAAVSAASFTFYSASESMRSHRKIPVLLGLGRLPTSRKNTRSASAVRVFFVPKSRVTEIIRTRQKCSIKAIFVAFTVALRQQGCHLKTPNLIFTPSIFDALQFIVCRFGLNRGKNAVNPFGLTSILTKSKGNICHDKPWFGLLPLP